MTITAGGRLYALLGVREMACRRNDRRGHQPLVWRRFLCWTASTCSTSWGREDLLYWLDGLAEDGEIETALLFATLKALPAALPDWPPRCGSKTALPDGSGGRMRFATHVGAYEIDWSPASRRLPTATRSSSRRFTRTGLAHTLKTHQNVMLAALGMTTPHARSAAATRRNSAY